MWTSMSGSRVQGEFWKKKLRSNTIFPLRQLTSILRSEWQLFGLCFCFAKETRLSNLNNMCSHSGEANVIVAQSWIYNCGFFSSLIVALVTKALLSETPGFQTLYLYSVSQKICVNKITGNSRANVYEAVMLFVTGKWALFGLNTNLWHWLNLTVTSRHMLFPQKMLICVSLALQRL